MYVTRFMQTSERKPLRAGDIFALSVGAVLLVCVLSALVFVVPRVRPAQIGPSADEVADLARKEAVAVAMAHREGTILFVDPDACQEHSFDNWTGRIEFKEQVDCDARIEQLRKTQSEKSVARMKSVVEGFRR